MSLSFDFLRNYLLERVFLSPTSALANFRMPFPDQVSRIWELRLKSHKFDYFYSALKLRLLRSQELVILSRKSALGDVVASTSAIAALRKARPNAHIIFHTSPLAAPLLLHDPDIDLILLERIQRKDYRYIDLSYEFYGKDETVHDRMVHAAGIEGNGYLPHLVLTPTEKKWAQDWRASFNLNGKNLVGIHAGFTMQNKAWPQKRWFELVKWLQESGHIAVEFGAVGGYDSCLGLSAHNLPLRTVMAMVSACDIVICIDSFIMHVAIALGVPCIPLFGGTKASIYVPVAAHAWPVSATSECRHCHHWGDQQRSFTPCIQERALCMYSIEFGNVLKALQRFDNWKIKGSSF
ncbi:MAG: glycosyltransferase family 9 protein [Bacteroidetes bacterium]|nr:glycosyltransferase family 9 protein [Bacteroidota bacterium]